jgi:hypothetical protein
MSPRQLTQSKGGNILIAGTTGSFSLSVAPASLLIKCTPDGDTLWSKKIEGGYLGESIYRVFELNNGNLLAVGDMDVPVPYNGRTDPSITMLTANGAMVWRKTFKTSLWVDTTSGKIDIMDCKEDSAGNLYFCAAVHTMRYQDCRLYLK